jgi:hypothetical protein
MQKKVSTLVKRTTPLQSPHAIRSGEVFVFGNGSVWVTKEAWQVTSRHVRGSNSMSRPCSPDFSPLRASKTKAQAVDFFAANDNTM